MSLLSDIRLTIPLPHSWSRFISKSNPDLVLPYDITDLFLSVLVYGLVNIVLYAFVFNRLSKWFIPKDDKKVEDLDQSLDDNILIEDEGYSTSTSISKKLKSRYNKTSLPNHKTNDKLNMKNNHINGNNNNNNNNNDDYDEDEDYDEKVPLINNNNIKSYEVGNRIKFMVSCWKFVAYTVPTSIGLYLAFKEEWLFNPSTYFANFHQPDSTPPMSDLAKLYYKVAFGNYVWSSISIFFEPRQKDFYIMSTHHLVTISLIVLSYIFPFYRIGCAILLLHDINDPIMEIAKCSLYMGLNKLADIFFGLFAITFIINRNYVFPFQIIYGIYKYGLDENTSDHEALVAQRLAIGFLCILESFHIYWASLIINMAKNAIVNKGVSDDARNDE